MSKHLPQDFNEQSLWASTVDPGLDVSIPSGSYNTEVLVIGGGYTGLSTALHLALQGISVILLEASHFGFGASGRNAGLVNAGVWQTPEHVERQLGKKAGERFNRALRNSPDLVFELIEKHAISCDAERCGTINIAHKAAAMDYLTDRHRQLRERGSDVSLIGSVKARSLTGSSVYRHGGILDPRAGTIQPLKYVRGLARAAIDQGAVLFQEARVLGFSQVDNRWRVRTLHAELTADKVVLATNAYSDEHCIGSQRSTLPAFIFHCATAPLPKEVAQSILPKRHGIWDTRLLLTSSRIDSADRLVMSSVGSLHGIPFKLRQDWMMRLRDRLYPATRGESWSFYWSGQIGMTSSKILRVQKLAPGILAPAGFNGRGIGPGTVIGKHLANLLATGKSEDFPFPLQSMKSESWRSLKGAYFEYGTLALQLVDQR